jgi:hypothetical protein
MTGRRANFGRAIWFSSLALVGLGGIFTSGGLPRDMTGRPALIVDEGQNARIRSLPQTLDEGVVPNPRNTRNLIGELQR